MPYLYLYTLLVGADFDGDNMRSTKPIMEGGRNVEWKGEVR